MDEIIENFRRIGSALNGVATRFNRRIFSWHLKQPLLFRSFFQKCNCVKLNISTRCIHTRYACFISIQMVIKIRCFVQDYEKSQQSKNGHPSDSPALVRPCPKPVRLAESRVCAVADRSLQMPHRNGHSILMLLEHLSINQPSYAKYSGDLIENLSNAETCSYYSTSNEFCPRFAIYFASLPRCG